MNLSLHAAKPLCQAVLKQCLPICTSSACQLAQAIKQDKTKLDCVGSSTTYYLHSRKVDSQATLSLVLSLLKTQVRHEGT